jgi:hypothetical protein
MQDSDTYLAILEEGMAKQAKRSIVLLGKAHLGPPNDSVRARLEAITDLERLDRMILEAGAATSWEDILQTP